MSHIKPVRALSSYSFKIALVFFSHPCPGLPGVLLLSGCPTKLCPFVLSPHTCHMPHPSYHPIFSEQYRSWSCFFAVFSCLLLLPVSFSASSLEHPLPMFFASYLKYWTKNRPAKAAFSPRRLRVLEHPLGQTRLHLASSEWRTEIAICFESNTEPRQLSYGAQFPAVSRDLSGVQWYCGVFLGAWTSIQCRG